MADPVSCEDGRTGKMGRGARESYADMTPVGQKKEAGHGWQCP
ncbi:hypothetical protein HMPREF9006_0386 [Actinomyces sp. oral taxon 180 str. F0310]|nr:hypothetical protein HMPREF9006_0386 [Actinomyces sp. oral taxon 180 str. F0310]